jgi:hypothetical protein
VSLVRGDQGAPVRGGSRVATALVSALVVIAALSLAAGCSPDDGARTAAVAAATAADAADFAYVIPLGTGERIDRGEPVDIIPGNLDVRVGQVLRIVNEDTRGHLVGPFFVGRGETLTQRFASAGTLSGACSIHPSGQITVTVRA